MAIPQGTKFHGVHQPVDTVNKGSAQVNALRDAYTIDQVSDYVINNIETSGPSYPFKKINDRNN